MAGLIPADLRGNKKPAGRCVASADGRGSSAMRCPELTTVSASREGELDARRYVQSVIEAYVSLPDTPEHASRGDRRVARALYARRVPLAVVKAAFLLAFARRTLRSEAAPSLSSVRTMHYFVPVVEELLERPLDQGYLQYLAHRLAHGKARAVFVDSG